MTANDRPERIAVPAWRIAAAVVVLAGLALVGVLLTPIYVHNIRLGRFVSMLARSADSPARPDDDLRSAVLDKARELNLPVRQDEVRVLRSASELRIDVRYLVRITLPGYTVDLHFSPSASNR